jgi:hypothetical protein
LRLLIFTLYTKVWEGNMLSQETLEAYRRMTPGERLKMTLSAMRESLPYLLRGSDDVVRRRFALIRQENDMRNQAMLSKLAATERES